MRPHPDRRASHLALRAQLTEAERRGPFDAPGAGSVDARVDLKLLTHRVRQALDARGTDAARERLGGLDGADLWAGTVQDGTARGFRVALEEALCLCEPPPPGAPEDDTVEVLRDRELHRKRDILIASAGPRVRFSPRRGLLLVDRARGVHVEDALGFEDRGDAGTLDDFAPVEGERPRLFKAGFLKATLLRRGERVDTLRLQGRLGRRLGGFPCTVEVHGDRQDPRLRIVIRVENRSRDHRLRLRLRGLPDGYPIAHDGTPGWERIEHSGGAFVAATLVRACGRLRVGEDVVAVPDAQCPGWIEHELRLGAPQPKS